MDFASHLYGVSRKYFCDTIVRILEVGVGPTSGDWVLFLGCVPRGSLNELEGE